MTLPSRLRSAIGVSEGDMVEASVHRGKIVLTPKVVIDHSKFPNADDEYTPENTSGRILRTATKAVMEHRARTKKYFTPQSLSN